MERRPTLSTLASILAEIHFSVSFFSSLMSLIECWTCPRICEAEGKVAHLSLLLVAVAAIVFRGTRPRTKIPHILLLPHVVLPRKGPGSGHQGFGPSTSCFLPRTYKRNRNGGGRSTITLCAAAHTNTYIRSCFLQVTRMQKICERQGTRGRTHKHRLFR